MIDTPDHREGLQVALSGNCSLPDIELPDLPETHGNCLVREASRWKRGKAKALAILGAKLARAMYHMLRKEEVFDEGKALGG